MPVWGSLDILEACGASDSGSNPDAGVRDKLTILCLFIHKIFRRNLNTISQDIGDSMVYSRVSESLLFFLLFEEPLISVVFIEYIF
jgi:hypothetical protein